MKTVYILRGLPGSGKSTFGQFLLNRSAYIGKTCTYCSADSYFLNEDGVYKFYAPHLPYAHEWCYNKFTDAVDRGDDVVILDNTNTTKKEFKKYLDYANCVACGYEVKIFTFCDTMEGIEGNKSVHNVPLDTMKKMKARWEPYEGEIIL